MPGPGIVYALTNEAFPELVKIGLTGRSMQDRARQLFTTGVPTPFVVGVAYHVQEMERVEQALHLAFDPYRYNRAREFFQIKVFQVRAILSLLGTEALNEDVTERVQEHPELLQLSDVTIPPIRRMPGPRAHHQEMGLPIGAEIVCNRNGAVATIAGPRSVLYLGREMSLSDATREVYGGSGGGSYGSWKFNGETLMKVYMRTQRTADTTDD